MFQNPVSTLVVAPVVFCLEPPNPGGGCGDLAQSGLPQLAPWGTVFDGIVGAPYLIDDVAENINVTPPTVHVTPLSITYTILFFLTVIPLIPPFP